MMFKQEKWIIGLYQLEKKCIFCMCKKVGFVVQISIVWKNQRVWLSVYLGYFQAKQKKNLIRWIHQNWVKWLNHMSYSLEYGFKSFFTVDESSIELYSAFGWNWSRENGNEGVKTALKELILWNEIHLKRASRQ